MATTLGRFLKLFIILFILTYSYADEKVFTRNVGGLNSKASPIFVGENEASDLLNIDLDTDGAIIKRKGNSVLNTTALSNQIDSLFFYRKNDGSEYLLSSAGGLYKMDSFDGTWDDVTGSTSITADTAGKMLIFDDTAIYTNGLNKIQEYDGTGTFADNDVVNDISLTYAKDMEVYQNRLYLGNVYIDGEYHPDRVYYSAAQNKDVWDGAYFTVGFDDGDEIIGLKTLGSYMFALRRNSIYRIRGTGDSTIPHTFDKTKATEGCIARGSIQTVNNMIVYLSQKGLAVFDGLTSTIISNKIKPTLDGLDGDLKVTAKSVVIEELNQYWLSVSDGSSEDRIIVWDYYHNAMLLHDGIHGSAFTALIDSNNEERIYFGDFEGYVYRANQGLNDNPEKVETPINAYYYTKHYDFGTLVFKKVGMFLTAIFQYSTNPSTLSVNYSYSLQDSDTFGDTITLQNPFNPIWDIALWDVDSWGGEGASYRRVDLTGSGITVRFKFSNNNLDETFSIYGWSVGYSVEEIIDN